MHSWWLLVSFILSRALHFDLRGEVTDDVNRIATPESREPLLRRNAGEAVQDAGVPRHLPGHHVHEMEGACRPNEVRGERQGTSTTLNSQRTQLSVKCARKSCPSRWRSGAEHYAVECPNAVRVPRPKESLGWRPVSG